MRFLPVALDDELLHALPGIRRELERQQGRALSEEEVLEHALLFLSEAAALLPEDFDGELAREVLAAIERMHPSGLRAQRAQEHDLEQWLDSCFDDISPEPETIWSDTKFDDAFARRMFGKPLAAGYDSVEQRVFGRGLAEGERDFVGANQWVLKQRNPLAALTAARSETN